MAKRTRAKAVRAWKRTYGKATVEVRVLEILPATRRTKGAKHG